MNPQTASVTTLLFDWDGTLVDSAQLGLTAFEQSFAVLEETFDPEIYREVYSPNWYSVYEAMGLPKEKWERADELWTQHYGEQTAQLVEGAKQTISALQDKGYRFGIVSSGNGVRVAREIASVGFENVFEVVVCHEQMENRKPHPEGLETALRLMGRSREESCYIGDAPEDIEMGKRAGLLTVGVRSGYPTSWKLRSCSPDIYLDSLPELPDYF
ncbi:MAG TPA: HAD-IA family hydrolase [Pyrinomonadaceae bacterium]|nr:HAD-IA family hydrolase [Pyrinomonadaceae bacterium]